VLIVIAGVTSGLTVIVTLAVTGLGLAQTSLLDIETDTTSPLLSVLVVNEPLVEEAFALTAFTNQVYVGVPPFTGLALIVRAAPAQTGFALVVNVTDGVIVGMMDTLTVLFMMEVQPVILFTALTV
jgi:hypothetical protein